MKRSNLSASPGLGVNHHGAPASVLEFQCIEHSRTGTSTHFNGQNAEEVLTLTHFCGDISAHFDGSYFDRIVLAGVVILIDRWLEFPLSHPQHHIWLPMANAMHIAPSEIIFNLDPTSSKFNIIQNQFSIFFRCPEADVYWFLTSLYELCACLTAHVAWRSQPSKPLWHCYTACSDIVPSIH